MLTKMNKHSSPLLWECELKQLVSSSNILETPKMIQERGMLKCSMRDTNPGILYIHL